MGREELSRLAPPGLQPDALALDRVAAGWPHLMWVREHLYHRRDNTEATPGPSRASEC
jgi:hypothetical protein